MKIRYILKLIISAALGFAIPGGTINAQEDADFRSEIYRDAIQNIVANSNGSLTRGDVLRKLESPEKEPFYNPESRADTLYLVPEIRLISYNSTTATFSYFPQNTFWEDSVFVSFPENPVWLTGTVTMDSISSTITIGTEVNESIEPRSTPVLVEGVDGGDTVSFTGFILQQPAPQQFIFVSPKYLAMSPEGGETEAVSVVALNVEDWTASFTEDWISVDSAQLTHTTIVFSVDENPGEEPRQASVEIHNIQNPDIKDELTIFQYADTSAYIIATPSTGYLNSGPDDFAVVVNANIPWKVIYDDVPVGMIEDSTISATGVIFQVTANASQLQRTAIISIADTLNQEISTQVQIIQAASSPSFIFVSPENSYVGPGASSITLTVDANVVWETEIYSDPDNMLTVGFSNQNSVTLNVAENNSTGTRIAEGRIKAPGSPFPADSFRVVQDPMFIIPNPTQKLVACEGETFMVKILKNFQDSLVIDTTGFLGDVTRFGNDSLQVSIGPNTGDSPKSDTLIICGFELPSVCAEVMVYQYACSQAYLILTPKFRSVGYKGGTHLPFLINSSNVTDREIIFEDAVNWVTDTLINGNELQFVLSPNTADTTRQATFTVRSVSDPNIFDTAVIFQDGAPSSFLLASPREQIVSHMGSDSLDFTVTFQNISGWEVDTANLADWIVADSEGGNLLSVDILSNPDQETRFDSVRIVATDNPLISDTVFIYQYAAEDAYILAAPRSDTILFTGENVAFQLTSVNTHGLDIDPLPGWISSYTLTDTLFKLEVDTNLSALTRNHTITIFDSINPGIRDSVSVYQYAAPESYILLAPRADTVLYDGDDNVVFNITAVNLPGQPAIQNPTPGWITANTLDDQLLLDVAENESDTTRKAAIYVFDDGDETIRDSVLIFQYARPEKYLLAAPREQRSGHEGGNLFYQITSLNVENWAVDDTPGWITVEQSGDFVLGLNIAENESLETRQAAIRIFDPEQPDIEDSVEVFQYSDIDHYLIASPREKKFSRFGTESFQFDILRANIMNWEVDAVPGWIQVNAAGENILDIEVLENPGFSARDTAIAIFSSELPDVRDTVYIYQYAASDTVLLAAPREAVVGFPGNNNLIFDITSQNADAWKVDETTLNSWIQLNNQGGDQFSLLIEENNEFQTRSENIIIYDTLNPAARDSVFIYQYSALQSAIIAAPREQAVAHTESQANYVITDINLPSGWEVDQNSIQDWITANPVGPFLSLDVSENTAPETRSDTISIQATGIPDIRDSVILFQYSNLDHFLLAAPRESKTGFQADTLTFEVTKTNIDSWQVEIIGNPDWVDTLGYGDNSLVLSVAENTDTTTRYAQIRLYSNAYPQADDTVRVYQYSTFSPFIVINPTFAYFPSDGDSLPIRSFSNMDTYFVDKEPGKDWVSISDSTLSMNDSVWLSVEPNPFSYLGRSSYLVFRNADSSVINYFYFQQRKNSLNFINISGSVFIDGDTEQPLDSTKIFVGEDSVYTSLSVPGFSFEAPYGWVGAITPQKEGYFFEPPSFVFETQQTDSIYRVFNAIEIDPQIQFNIEGDTLNICYGDQIDLSSPDYPTFSVSGTFGQRKYHWYSEPPDPNLPADTANAPAYVTFAPEVTTTYYLELFNYGTSDVTSFTVKVNPLPEASLIEGPASVCRNQAGTIFYAGNYDPAEGHTFSWSISGPGNVDFLSGQNSNIAVIDWGNTSGIYELTLNTYNQLGCSNFSTKEINVSDATAPPGTVVMKKEGVDMLVCLDTLVNRYEWGWDTLINGRLGGRYFIPDRNDWYCQLPEGHNFDPLTFRYFVITYYDGLDCGSLTYYNPPMSVEESVSDELMVFPNPTNRTINIRIPHNEQSGQATLRVLNISGQEVFSAHLFDLSADRNITVNETGRLEQGIYFIRLEMGNRVYNQKVVVQ